MFIKSAASHTGQGKAIQSINEKWGQGQSSGRGRPWGGRETIGIQVCKKKYTPFIFTIEGPPGPDDDENDAKNSNATATGRRKVIKVVRMFGCPHHSDIRKERIECHGVRKGWEPFGQWSLRKAQQLARRETIRLNSRNNNNNGNGNDNGNINNNNSNNSNCDDGDKKIAALTNGGNTNNAASNTIVSAGKGNNNSYSNNVEDIKSICHNGKCIWKMRNKYDNVYKEITGDSESTSEEDT